METPLCEILNTPLDVVARIRNSIFGRPWFLTSSATKTPAPAPFILSNDLITSRLSRTAPLLTTPTRRLAEINLANRTHSITVIIVEFLFLVWTGVRVELGVGTGVEFSFVTGCSGGNNWCGTSVGSNVEMRTVTSGGNF